MRSFSRISTNLRWFTTHSGTDVNTNSDLTFPTNHSVEVEAGPLSKSLQVQDREIAWGKGDGGYGRSKDAVIDQWLKLGKHPNLDAMVHAKPEDFEQRINRLREDHYGTDLNSPNKRHRETSYEFWYRIFKQNALQEMRYHSEASKEIGKMTFRESEVVPLRSAADDPTTEWLQDESFSAFSQTCAFFFGVPPRNMREFDEALLSASGAQLYGFWSNALKSNAGSLQHPNLHNTPLSYYDGERLENYCNLLAAHNKMRMEFVRSVLTRDMQGNGGKWETVAGRIAFRYESVYKVLRRRRIRWIDKNIVKAWTLQSDSEQFQNARKDIILKATALTTGEYDPPDGRDTSEVWKMEHQEIMALMTTQIEGLSFSLLDYWKKMECSMDILHEHVFTDPHFQDTLARALVLTLRGLDGDIGSLYLAYTQMLSSSSIDVQSGIVFPYMNVIWCQLNWPIFGSTNRAQETEHGRRIYQHNHVSLAQVKAVATAFYKLQPLSSSVEYTSPYTYTNTRAEIHAHAGVESLKDLAKEADSNQVLVEWERDLALISRLARAPVGKARRRYQTQVRAAFEKDTSLSGGPIQNVRLERVAGDFNNIDLPTPVMEVKKSETPDQIDVWKVGTRVCIKFDWDTPDRTTLMVSATTERSRELLRGQLAVLEFTLWKKRDVAADSAALNQDLEKAKAACAATPQLIDMSHYTLKFITEQLYPAGYGRDSNNAYLQDPCLKIPESKNDPFLDSSRIQDDDEHTHWTYVCTLSDNAPLRSDLSYNLILPFSAALIGGERSSIPDGTYRVRVRGYRKCANTNRNAFQCVQAHSRPFTLKNDVSQNIQEFLKKYMSGKHSDARSVKIETDLCSTFIPGEWLIPLVRFLRTEQMYAIPLEAEFHLGQKVTPRGEIEIGYILDSLFNMSGVPDASLSGISPEELDIDQRMYRFFEELNPGCTLDEYMSQRRFLLLDAFESTDVSWWTHDPSEEPEKRMNLGNMKGLMRYLHDKTISLSARGSYSMHAPGSPAVEATFEGCGSISNLRFDRSIMDASRTIPLKDALVAVHGAIHNAHARLNLLAHFKMSPRLEELRENVQELASHHLQIRQWGGKYLRTYRQCANMAFEKVHGRRPSLSEEIRNQPIERWGHYDYKFRTERPTTTYRIGPHEALQTCEEQQWPR